MAEQPTNPPEIPSHEDLNAELGQYNVLECVGVGGMGGVYKAHQENLDRLVAIKVLARGIGTEEFAEHFQSEAQAMARLNQTNIISVYDFGLTANGWLYFVMEFVDGKTLFELLHDNLIDRAAAVATITQVCGALKYAHEHGVVHRDIKSANILVDSHGHAKVGDFGLAKLYAEEGNKGLGDSSFGTPDYAAPEVIDPNAEIDHRADIYSVGALFFELLTGNTPDIKTKPISGSAFDSIIQKAMAADPHDRYQSASELRQAIEDTWSASTSGKAPLPIEKSPKPAGNKILAAVAAVAVLGAVVAMILKGNGNEEDKDPKGGETTKTTEQPKGNQDGGGSSPGPKVGTTNDGKNTKSGAKGDEGLSSIFEGGVIKDPPPKDPDPGPGPPENPPNVAANDGPKENIVIPPIEVVPKEPTEADKRIQPILDSFHPRFESSVVSPYQDKVKTLRANYLGALAPIEEKLKNAGNPQGVLEVRAEIQRLQTGEAIPIEDSGVTELDTMRRKYLATSNDYRTDRNAKAERLLTGLNGLLEELESELTREAELDIAVDVRDYRTNLKDNIMRHFFPEEFGEAEPTAKAPSDSGGGVSAILVGQVWKRQEEPHFLLEFVAGGNVRYKDPDGKSDPWEKGNPKWVEKKDKVEVKFSMKSYPVGGGLMLIEEIGQTTIKLRNPNRKLGGLYTGLYEKL